MKKQTLLFCLLACAFALKAQTLPAPSGLTVELLRAPKASVITNPSLDFAWIFPQDGIRQGCQIIIASEQFLLKNPAADLRHSGMEINFAAVIIGYGGNSLISNSSYKWRVKVWPECVIAAHLGTLDKCSQVNLKIEKV